MKNYFDIFNIPINFNINTKDLKSKYSNLVKSGHPDNFVDNKELESKAVDNMAIINESFKILNDDLLRANYILKLKGINALDEKNTHLNKDFVQTQIELREELATLDDEQSIDDFLNKIIAIIKQHVSDIKKDFENSNLENVQNSVRELKFYYQLQKDVESKLDKTD